MTAGDTFASVEPGRGAVSYEVLFDPDTGAVRLALRTGAPVIPVGLCGTDDIQPADVMVPRLFRSCQVNIGQPIDMTRYLDRYDDRMLQRQLTDEVMFEMLRFGRGSFNFAAGEQASATVEVPGGRLDLEVGPGNGSAAKKSPAKKKGG